MQGKTLPKKLLLPLAVLLVLLASALLVRVFHNDDTYRTGFWDDFSQSLVFARMLQMQQDQSAPGGFLGSYTGELGDSENRYLYRENTPVDPADYMSYSHQSGLQGWGFGVLNKVFSVFQDEGEARERMLYGVNSLLFYAATLAVALAAWRAFGAPAGVGWLVAALLSPWVQRGMKDLYWCLWTWLLPALAGLLLCALTRRRGRTPRWCYPLVALACMVRCMCGFEFISTFLILCEIPLFAAWASCLADPARRGEGRGWFLRMVFAGLWALGGVAAALAVWFLQGLAYFGSAGKSLENILGAALFHTGGEAGSPVVSAGAVLWKYLTSADPVLQIGGAGVTVAGLLAVTAGAFALTAALLLWLDRAAVRALVPLGCVWLLSFAAPVSWILLARVHCSIHTHLVPMLWNFALAPASCMALGGMLRLLARAAKARRPR